MEDILEIESPEVQEPTQQPEPPIRKLYKVVKDKGLYTKSYDEFVKQYSTPEAKDKLHKVVVDQGLYTKSRQDFDAQYFPSSKKKVARVDFEGSSLEAGNALSGGVGGTEIPTVEMYSTPSGELVETDPVSLSKKFKQLSEAVKPVSDIEMGMSRGMAQPVIDEGKRKEAEKLKQDFPNIDFEGIYEDTKDLSDDLLDNYKRDILPDKETNNQLYQRKLSNIKWRSGIEKSLLDLVNRGGIKPDDYNNLKAQIDNLPITASQGDYTNQRDAIRSVSKSIQLFGGEKKDEILRNFAVEASKIYGNPFNKSDKTFKDTPESKYLNDDAQLGYQYLSDVDPEKAEQYKRLFIDKNLIKDDPDQKAGYDHLMLRLEETGIGLKQNAIDEEINSLKKIATEQGGLSETQIERAKKLEDAQAELTQKREELDRKYPERIENKVDDALQEIMGQKIGLGSYTAGKAWIGIRNTGQGIWEAVSSPFMSDQSNVLRELAIMGEGLEEEKVYHKTDRNKNVVYDEMVFQPDLQKQIDEIKNNGLLTNDQKEQKLYTLLKENTDKFGRVPIKGGKFNVSGSSIFYGLSDLGTSLLPFMALEYGTAGLGSIQAATFFKNILGNKGAKFLNTFTIAAATTFHNEYANAIAEGKPQSEAYKSAMASTAINSLAMAGAGTPTEIKAMANGKTSAGKLIQSMSDDAIQKVLDKGTPKGLKAIGQSFKERAKELPKQFAEGLKTGAKFEAYMAGANALNGREVDAKRSIMAIAEFGILGAGLGQIGFKSPTQLQKSAGLEFGKNPEGFKAIAEAMRKDGQLDEAQYNQRIELIDRYKEAYKTLPKADAKGNELTPKQKEDYLYNAVIKNEGNRGKSNLPPKQAEKAEMTAMVADHKNDLILEPKTDKQLQSRKEQLEKQLEKKDEEGKLELTDKERKNAEAELEAINQTIKEREDTTKSEEKLPKLTEPIEGTNEYGVSIGEYVPPEVKGEPENISKPIELNVEPNKQNLTKEAEDLLASIGEGSKPTFITKNLEKIAKENGIEVTDKMSADDVINALKEKQSKPTNEPITEPVTKPIPEVTEPTKEQGIKEAVPEGTIEAGRTKPERAATVLEGEPELPQRRFTQQMLRSEDLSPEAKQEIAKTLNYVRQSHEMTLKEANEVIDKVGLDEAQNMVIGDNNLKPVVRNAVGMTLIKKFNELSEKATTPEEKDYYLDKSIQTATAVTERYGTEAGQSIEIFKLWSQLSPEGQLRSANQDMAVQAKEKLRRREKDINKIGKEFQKANEEAINEVVKSEILKEEPAEKPSKAQQKIIKAKEKRASIIKKYKDNKGKSLFSSPAGLTPEGIEFVGNVAKTYIEEGIANIEVLVEKVLKHLEEVSGKKVTDEIKNQVREESDKMLNKSDIRLLSEGLKEKKIKIADIVTKHYTDAEQAKKKLAQKLMDEADMGQSNAAALVKKVEDAFDRIATRKKRNILYNEKARFDKINNTLKGSKKVEKKTLADEIIRYSNLGAFENKDFADMIANKFGLGELAPEQAAKLIELARKVEKAAEGTPKNNAMEDLLSYRANLRGNDLGETAQAVWYANVLSGYKTHQKNVISTFFNSMGELGAEMIKDPKAIPYLIGGYIKGLTKRGFVEARHTLATGYSPIHIKKIEVPNVLERKKFKGGAINPANWFKYIMRMMVAEDVLSFQSIKEARAYQLARREIAGKFPGINTWSRKAWDEANKVLLHTKERYDEAYQTIKEEGLLDKKGNPTLSGRRRIYELMENSRPEKMVEDSYGFAAKGTFNHESEGSLGAITNAIASAIDSVSIGSFKPGRLVIPFTRIITNVVNNSLDYTPVGMVRAARGVRGFRSFEKSHITKPAFKELSREERQRLIAKASLGITLAATFQAMHQSGVIQVTGGGTGNAQKDEQLRQSGWQEYSIKIGDKYYSYKYTPLVFMLGYLGNMNDVEKYGDDDKKTLDKKMQVASSRIAGQVVDMTWINSASTFLGSLAEPNPDRQSGQVKKALAGMARGFVPFSGAITQGTQALNGVFGANKKATDGAFQALIASVPIASNMYNDKINALGEPIKVNENTTWYLPDFVSIEKSDEVWQLLSEKNGWVAPINPKTFIIYDPKIDEERLGTPDEYYEFSKNRGTKIKDKLKEAIKAGEFIDWNTGEAIKLKDVSSKDFNKWLSKVKSEATKEAKMELFGESPEKTGKNLDINQ